MSTGGNQNNENNQGDFEEKPQLPPEKIYPWPEYIDRDLAYKVVRIKLDSPLGRDLYQVKEFITSPLHAKTINTIDGLWRRRNMISRSQHQQVIHILDSYIPIWRAAGISDANAPTPYILEKLEAALAKAKQIDSYANSVAKEMAKDNWDRGDVETVTAYTGIKESRW